MKSNDWLIRGISKEQLEKEKQEAIQEVEKALKKQELKPCPFCGGNAKLSAKDHLFGGWNGVGQYRKEYYIKAICNRCRARGKPIATGWVSTSYCARHSYFTREEDKQKFYEAEQKAINAWNRRAGDDKR